MDLCPKRGEGLSVFCLRKAEGFCDPFTQRLCLCIGRIYGRQPFCQKRNRTFSSHCLQVLGKLLPQDGEHLLLTGCIHENEKIIISAVFRDIFQILFHSHRLIERKPVQDDTKHPSLPQASSNISRVKEDFHGKIRILGIRTDKSANHLRVACTAKRTDRGKEVQAL